MEPPSSWTNRACIGMDPIIFHPDNNLGVKVAVRVCANCEVRGRCLEWAIATNERFGVWGGTSERERRRIRRRRAA